MEILSYFWYEYKSLVFLFGIIISSFILSIYFNWPKSLFEFKIKNKDVYIWVKIWDIFKSKWAIIVPINNKFDPEQSWYTSNKKSILSLLIKNVYDQRIQHIMQDIESNWITVGGRYELWKTIKIEHKNRKFYLVCNTRINSSGRSISTKEDIPPTLTFLFEHLSFSSDKEEIINIPLLNSGHWRIPDMTREMIFKEIVYFFIEGLKNKDICDKFIIYIHPDDVKKWEINIEKIVDFLKYNAENYRDINYIISDNGLPTS